MTASEALTQARIIKSLHPETLIEPKYMRAVLEGTVDAYDALVDQVEELKNDLEQLMQTHADELRSL